MLAPYDNNAASTGLPNYSAEDLDRIVRVLDARGYQIMIHAIGDGGVRRVLDAFERAARANPAPARGRRHRVEHIETMDMADVRRFGALGVIGSFQPPHARLMNAAEPRGQWAGNIGPERTSHGWMWKSVKRRGRTHRRSGATGRWRRSTRWSGSGWGSTASATAPCPIAAD